MKADAETDDKPTPDFTKEVAAQNAVRAKLAAFLPGQLLNGRYEVERAIGRGGMGRRLVRKGHVDKAPLVELGDAALLEANGKHAKADTFFARALASARATLLRVRYLASARCRARERGDEGGARRDLDEARAIAIACSDIYTRQLCDEALAALQH